MSAKPRTPQSVVERIFKDSQTRKRLFAATSVLSLLTVVVTVGVLTFPAISISGSHEALQEQGVNITESENTVELFAEAAAETAQLVANRGEAVATSDAFVAGADAPADGVATPIEGTTIVAPEVATDAASAPDAAAIEQGGAASASATSDADQAADVAAEIDQDTSSEAEQDAPTPVAPSASAERALQEADLASKRLIVGAETTEAAAALAADEHAVAAFDGVYLLQYKNEEEAAQGFLGYYDSASFVTPDVAVQIADDAALENIDPQEEIISTNNIFTEEENPFAELEAALDEAPTQQAALAAKARDVLLVALVDTGVASANSKDVTEAQAAAAIAANVVDAVSMVGESPRDDNGHGQRMAAYIVDENPAAQILSIKALGKNGTGDVSAVIAGINYAIERGANIINLSLCAYASDENAALADAIRRAEEAGVVVVGAAGNQGYNARYYIPGNIEEAFVVGSADEAGKRIEASNFGDTVDYNVVSAATSEAAARMSGILSADALQESVDAAKVFPADFDPDELADGEQDAQNAQDTSADAAPDGEEGADTEDVDADGTDGEDANAENADNEDSEAADKSGDETADTSSASNAPAAFSGAQAQGSVTWASIKKQIDDAKNSGTTNLTITMDGEVAADCVIDIPADLTVTINGNGNTIYKLQDVNSLTSYFNVVSGGALNLDNVILDARAVVGGTESARADSTMNVGGEEDEFTIGGKKWGYMSDYGIYPDPNWGNSFHLGQTGGFKQNQTTSIEKSEYLIRTGNPSNESDTNNYLRINTSTGQLEVVNVSYTTANSNNEYKWELVWDGEAQVSYFKNKYFGVPRALYNNGGKLAWKEINATSSTSFTVADGLHNAAFITSAGTVNLTNTKVQNADITTENVAPIVVTSGTFNINADTSIENNSGITAGAIYVSGANATVNINGGSIKNNKAEVKDDAGNTLDPAYQVTIEDDMLSENTLQVSAGGIVINGGTVNLNDGVISGNVGHAGAFYIIEGGTLEMTGGKIGEAGSANVGRNAGAGVVDKGTFNMYSGSIEYNDTLQRGTITVLPNGKMNMDVGEGLLAPTIHNNRTTNKGGAIYVDSDNVKLVRGEIANNTAGYMGGAIYVVGDKPENTRVLEFGSDPAYKAYIYENTAGTLPGFTTRWGDGRGGGAWFCAWSTVLYDERRVEIADNYLGTQREGGGIDVFKTAGLGMIAEWTKTALKDNEEFEVDTFSNWRTNDGVGATFWVKRSQDAWYGEEKLKNSNSIDASVKNKPEEALLIHDNQAALGGGLGLNGIITFRKIPVYRKVAWADLVIHKDWENNTDGSKADPTDKKVEITVTLKGQEGAEIGSQTFTLENGKIVNGAEGVGTTGDAGGVTIGGSDITDKSNASIGGQHIGWYASIPLPSYVASAETKDALDSIQTPYRQFANVDENGITYTTEGDMRKATFNLSSGNGYTLEITEIVYQKRGGTWVVLDPSSYDLSLDTITTSSGQEATHEDVSGAVTVKYENFNLSTTLHNSYNKRGIVDVQKVDGDGTALEGAKFVLARDNNGTTEYAKVDAKGDVTSWVKVEDGAADNAEGNNSESAEDKDKALKASVARTTPESGMLSYGGLEPGAYWIEEVEAPFGYSIDGNGRKDFVIGNDYAVHAPNALSYEVGIASNGALSLGGKSLTLGGKQLYVMDLDGVSRTTLNSTWQYLIASIPSASGDYDGADAFTWVQNGAFTYRTLKDENYYGNAKYPDEKGYMHRWEPVQVNGHWAFKNYGLEQNRVAEKYLALDADGNIKLVNENQLVADFDSVVVANPTEKTYPVTITKKSSSDGSVLPGATFRLTTKDNQGNERFAFQGSDDIVWVDAPGDGTANDKTIWTSAKDSGAISFNGLKPGTYYLREVAAPAGYVTSTKTLEFTVSDTGEVKTTNAEFITNPGAIGVGGNGELYIDSGKTRVQATQDYNSSVNDLFIEKWVANGNTGNATLYENGTLVTSLDDIATGNQYAYLLKDASNRYAWDGNGKDYLNYRGEDNNSYWANNATYGDEPGRRMRWIAKKDESGQIFLVNSETGRYLVYDASASGSKFRLVRTLPAAELQFTNDPINTDVTPTLTLNKQDENGNPLTGATFTIALKDDSNSAKEVTSKNNDGTFEFDFAVFGNDYAPNAVFVLTETTSPDGYTAIKKQIEFTIDRAGKITWAAGYVPDGNISISTEIVSGVGNETAGQGNTESVEDPNFTPYNNEGADWGQKGANGQKVTFAPIKDAQGNVIEGAQVTLTRIPSWDTSLRYENAKWLNTSANYGLTLIRGEEYVLSAAKDGYTIATKQFKVGGSASVNNGDGYVPQQHTTSTTDAQQTVTYLQNGVTGEDGWYSPKSVVYSGGVEEQVFCGVSYKSAEEKNFRTRTVWNGAGVAWWAGPGVTWYDKYFNPDWNNKYPTWLDRVAYLYSYDYASMDSSGSSGAFSNSNDPQVLTGYALQQAVQRVLYNGYPYNAAGFTNTGALRKTTQEALFYVLRNGKAYIDGYTFNLENPLEASSYRKYAEDKEMFDALVKYALLGTQTKPWNFQDAPAGTEIYVYWYTNGKTATNFTSQPLIGIYAPLGQEVATTGQLNQSEEETPIVTRDVLNVKNNPTPQDYTKPTLTLKKTDVSGTALAGAVFTISEKDGTKTQEITVGADGMVTFDFAGLDLEHAYSPDTIYVLKEITAPEGYVALDSDIEFKISRDGTIALEDSTDKDKVTLAALPQSSTESTGEDQTSERKSTSKKEDEHFTPFNYENTDWGQKGANGQKVTFTPIKDAQGNVIEGAQVTLKRVASWKNPVEYWDNAKWINTSSNYELTLIKGEEYILSVVKDGYNFVYNDDGGYKFTVGAETTAPSNGDGYTPQQHATSTTNSQISVGYSAGSGEAGWYSPKSVTYDGVTEQVFCGTSYKSASATDYPTRTVWNGAGNAWWAGPGTNWQEGLVPNAKINTYATWLDRVAYLYSFDYHDTDSYTSGSAFSSSSDPQVLTGYALQQAVQRVLYNGYPYNAAGFTNIKDLRKTTQEALFFVLHKGKGYKDGVIKLGDDNTIEGYRYHATDKAMFDALVKYALLGTQTKPWNFQEAPAGTEIYVYWHTNESGGVAELGSQPLIGIYAPFGSQKVTTMGSRVTPTTDDTNKTPYAIQVGNERLGYAEILKVYKDENGIEQPLSGATLQILDSTGNSVVIGKDAEGKDATSWVTDGTAKTISLPPGTYKLHEEAAPNGYGLAADVEFTLRSDDTKDKPCKVTMEDPKSGEVIIRKLSGGHDLSEATLEVVKAVNGQPGTNADRVVLNSEATGEKQYQWVSNGQELKIKGLQPGTYYVHEVSAPDDFVREREYIEFTVEANSGTTSDDSSVSSASVNVINESKTVDVVVNKQWFDESNEPTTDPKYKGNTIDSINVVFIRGIKEDNASEAFKQQMTITKDAKADHTSIEVDGKSYAIEDGAWGLTIKGLPYAFVDSNGSVKHYEYSIEEVIDAKAAKQYAVKEGTSLTPEPTSENGIGNTAYTYTFKLQNKVNAPETYGFTLIKGNDWNDDFKDAIEKGSLDSAKTANKSESTGMKLTGAEFMLKDVTPSTGRSFSQYHTATTNKYWKAANTWVNGDDAGARLAVDENGVFAGFEQLYPGEYILYEVKAPNGYESIDDNTTKFWRIKIEDGGEVTFASSEAGSSNGNDNLIKIYNSETTGDNTHIVGITNVPKTYSLPSTGGVGVVPFALCAVLAFAFALARLKHPLRRSL